MTGDHELDFLHAADPALADVDHLCLPVLALRVMHIHAV